MTLKQAMQQVEEDHRILARALSNLLTVQALYALGESEKAINLYGATRSGVNLAMRSFPVLEAKSVQA